ncbi:MAG: hypothetical protein NC928_02030 [Candidatus Omnitrophica bacterium]|nr:hypothetical protein [Candidatus Omnitrophota bacterium]
MQKKEIYRKILRYLIKFSTLLCIIIVCLIFFFLVKKTKDVKVAIGLLENIRFAEVDSNLFNALKESYVINESIKGLKKEIFLEDENFFYCKIIPKYPVLIDFNCLLPIEMHLYKNTEEIPYKEKDFGFDDNISWHFAFNERKKLFYIDARDMYLSNDEGSRYTQKLAEGMFIAANSNIYYVLELPAGLKEFKINAQAKRIISQYDPHFDYSAKMRVFLDGKIIGEATAEEEKMRPFIFNVFVPAGWHKIEIAFINDVWQPEKGWDRNLLVKDLEISDLLGTVYLKINKSLGETFLNKNYSLSYLRILNNPDKNELIRFFKNKFRVESFKDIVVQDFPVSALIKEVAINNLIKRAIFAPAPSKIKLGTKVPIDGIRLVFSFGIMEEAWDKSGDGVEFIIKASVQNKEKKTEEVLFRRYINPKTNEGDRQWFIGEVDLRRYRGKNIELVFETKGSPVSPLNLTEDCAYDWAVWSD